jgi:hypothetical protein
MGGVAAVIGAGLVEGFGAGWAAAGVLELETRAAQASTTRESEAEIRMVNPSGNDFRGILCRLAGFGNVLRSLLGFMPVQGVLERGFGSG